MYGKVKLTKRQIKEDKFTAFMLTSKDRLSSNWQYVAIGVAVLILLVVSMSYWYGSLGEAKIEAANRLSNAMGEYRQGNVQVAVLSLSDVVNRYGDDPSAQQATFLLGVINFETHNYPEAIRYYEIYLANYREDKFKRVAAVGGIASSLENQGQYAEAVVKFTEAYEMDPEGPLAEEYQVAAMRNCLLNGDFDQARLHLDIIEENFGGSDAAKKAALLFNEKSRG